VTGFSGEIPEEVKACLRAEITSCSTLRLPKILSCTLAILRSDNTSAICEYDKDAASRAS